MESSFRAKLSIQSKLFTLLLNFAITFICYILLFRDDLLKNTNQPPEIVKFFVIFILVVIFILAYIYHPTKYIVTNKYFGIKKPFHLTKFSLNSIKFIKEIDRNELAVRSRIFASGGLWGYFGIFYSNNFGKVKMNVSNYDNLVLIVTKSSGIIIISPENPTEFVNQLNSQLQ